jgi:hypothetical protein
VYPACCHTHTLLPVTRHKPGSQAFPSSSLSHTHMSLVIPPRHLPGSRAAEHPVYAGHTLCPPPSFKVLLPFFLSSHALHTTISTSHEVTPPLAATTHVTWHPPPQEPSWTTSSRAPCSPWSRAAGAGLGPALLLRSGPCCALPWCLVTPLPHPRTVHWAGWCCSSLPSSCHTHHPSRHR